MPTVPVINVEGAPAGELEVSERVFGRKGGESVVHQALEIELNNARQGNADTKTRAEVRGGGKKPWRQKGTGHARHGSTRSPIWAHGGTAHGPTPHSYAKQTNKKEKRAAFRYALSARLAAGDVVAVDALTLPEPKTREMVALLGRLGIGAAKTLVLVEAPNDSVRRASNNLQHVIVKVSPSVALRELLWADKILSTAAALQRIEENLDR